MLFVLRCIAGCGLGGEYSSINSAIDELMPARLRGRIDLAINATYWCGVGFGALLTLFLLDERFFPIEWGWRFSFLLGAVFGLVVLAVRRNLKESPRWLVIHRRVAEAEEITKSIEQEVLDGAFGSVPRNELDSSPRAQLTSNAKVKMSMGQV